jgi:hypothetical protein
VSANLKPSANSYRSDASWHSPLLGNLAGATTVGLHVLKNCLIAHTKLALILEPQYQAVVPLRKVYVPVSPEYVPSK